MQFDGVQSYSYNQASAILKSIIADMLNKVWPDISLTQIAVTTIFLT